MCMPLLEEKRPMFLLIKRKNSLRKELLAAESNLGFDLTLSTPKASY